MSDFSRTSSANVVLWYYSAMIVLLAEIIIMFYSLIEYRESLSEMLESYDRVIDSINDIQVTRITVPWEDFNKLLFPISKVPISASSLPVVLSLTMFL